MITSDHIGTDPAQVQSIADCPVSKNLTERHSFTGFAYFYCHYTLHYPELTKPLDDLKRNDTPYI